jgi:hypothetical protein
MSRSAEVVHSAFAYGLNVSLLSYDLLIHQYGDRALLRGHLKHLEPNHLGRVVHCPPPPPRLLQ